VAFGSGVPHVCVKLGTMEVRSTPPGPATSFAPASTELTTGYRADIQGLRAVAVLAVLAFHGGLPVPGGFLGVDVFFVISGFVITAMLDREWRATGRISFANFYFRRFKRLTPALAALVTVVIVASVVWLSPLGGQQELAMTGIGALLLGANFVLQRTVGGYFDLDAGVNPLLHTWSLSVEEQIYVGLPLVLVLAWLLSRRTGWRWVPTVALAAITALSLAAIFVPPVANRLPETLGGFFGPVPRIWEFGVGALLALLPVIRLPRAGASALGLLGAALVVAGVLVASSTTAVPGIAMLLPVAGTVAIIAAGSQGHHHVVARALGSRAMVIVGDRSYSLYLWHWPFVVFATMLVADSTPARVLAVLLSVGAAVASYRWIERPLRRRPVPTPAARVRFVAIVAIPPIVLGLGLWGAASKGYGNPDVVALSQATIPLHVTFVEGCTWEIFEVNDRRCRWNEDAIGPPIYLIGDSNADHFSEAVIGVAGELNRPLETSIASGCPPLQADITRDILGDEGRQRCQVYADTTLTWLDDAPPGLVIYSITSTYWTVDHFSVGPPGAGTVDSDEKLAVFEPALAEAVERITAAGHEVLIVQPIPRFGWDPLECSLATILEQACAGSVALGDIEEAQREAWEITQRVADDAGVVVLDLTTVICPAGVCSTVTADGIVLYRDPDHISVSGGAVLEDDFLEVIARDK